LTNCKAGKLIMAKRKNVKDGGKERVRLPQCRTIRTTTTTRRKKRRVEVVEKTGGDRSRGKLGQKGAGGAGGGITLLVVGVTGKMG